MKTAKRICLKSHSFKVSEEETYEINEGQEYVTSIERDGEVTVFTGYWIHGVPVEWFGTPKEGPGEEWDCPVDIETSLRIYHEYCREFSIHPPFTHWCERQLAEHKIDPDGDSRRAEQLDTNMKFLLECTDAVCHLLLPDFVGTWQERAEAAVGEAKRISKERGS